MIGHGQREKRLVVAGTISKRDSIPRHRICVVTRSGAKTARQSDKEESSDDEVVELTPPTQSTHPQAEKPSGSQEADGKQSPQMSEIPPGTYGAGKDISKGNRSYQAPAGTVRTFQRGNKSLPGTYGARQDISKGKQKLPGTYGAGKDISKGKQKLSGTCGADTRPLRPPSNPVTESSAPAGPTKIRLQNRQAPAGPTTSGGRTVGTCGADESPLAEPSGTCGANEDSGRKFGKKQQTSRPNEADESVSSWHDPSLQRTIPVSQGPKRRLTKGQHRKQGEYVRMGRRLSAECPMECTVRITQTQGGEWQKAYDSQWPNDLCGTCLCPETKVYDVLKQHHDFMGHAGVKRVVENYTEISFSHHNQNLSVSERG